MTILFIVNDDPPYDTERVYNALRLAHALLKKEPEPVERDALEQDFVLDPILQPGAQIRAGTRPCRSSGCRTVDRPRPPGRGCSDG